MKHSLKTETVFIQNINKIVMKIRIKHVVAALIFLNSYILSAQDLSEDLKSWTGLGTSYKINKNIRIKFYQILALNIPSSTFSFSQTDLSLSYKIKSGMYAESGYEIGLFNASNSLERQGAYPSLFGKLSADRIFGKFSYRQRLAKRLSLYHKFEFQYYLPDLNKYKTRSLYTAKFSYNVRKTSFTPYLEGRIYYYEGGQRVSNGIKRYRVKGGARFKPVKDSSMKVYGYFIWQNEFNTYPLSGNDYFVLGTAISFRIQ